MLNENIKKYRLEKNMTQEELADSLHIVRQTVSKWENNRAVPDAQMLVNISKILDVPVLKLLGESDDTEVWDRDQTLCPGTGTRGLTPVPEAGVGQEPDPVSQHWDTGSDPCPTEELSRRLAQLNEKLAREIRKRRLIMRIIVAVVGFCAVCFVAVALTYYNPVIRYSVIKPVDSDTEYYYEDIHISYKTRLGLPLPLKYKELIADFTEKSAAVMNDIRNNYEAPMHIEITVINDKNSTRVLYSGTVTKDGKVLDYTNSFWVAGNFHKAN